VIITVAVGNIPAAAIVELDLEAVADIAGVVDGIEVVDGSVGDAGLDVIGGRSKQAGGAACFHPEPETARVQMIFCFHFSSMLVLVRISPRHSRASNQMFCLLSGTNATPNKPEFAAEN
jgi:hypothetical protein